MVPRSLRRPDRTAFTNLPAALMGASVVSLLILAGSFVMSLNSSLHGPNCLVLALFHVHCPGCGITRSMIEIWRGNPVLSFRYHPLGIPVFMICFYLLGVACFVFFKRDGIDSLPRLRAIFLNRTVMYIFTAIMLSIWVLRLIYEKTGNHSFLW